MMLLPIKVALPFAIVLCFQGDTAPHPKIPPEETADTAVYDQAGSQVGDGVLSPLERNLYDSDSVDGFLPLPGLIERETT